MRPCLGTYAKCCDLSLTDQQPVRVRFPHWFFHERTNFNKPTTSRKSGDDRRILPIFSNQPMKANRLLLLSAGLNLILAGASVWLLFGHSDRAPVGAKSDSPAPQAPAKFNWRQLESEDFSTYIANLRAVGCPEQTVRSIVTAEVAAQFEEERQAIASCPATTEAARRQQRQLLDRLPCEQQAVVAGLLGSPSGGTSPAVGSSASNAGTSSGQPAFANAASGGNASTANAPSAILPANPASPSASTQQGTSSISQPGSVAAAAGPSQSGRTRPSWMTAQWLADQLYRAKYGTEAFLVHNLEAGPQSAGQ